MDTRALPDVPYRFFGEFVDEASVPTDVTFGRGEAVLPASVGTFVDLVSEGTPLKDFTVFLRDGRIVAVRGHAVQVVASIANGEREAYGVVRHEPGRDELVALFRASEVNGIFHGEIRAEPSTA